MHLTGNKVPAGFDTDFALNIALPIAEAAYAVMQNPAAESRASRRLPQNRAHSSAPRHARAAAHAR
jgi:hypothetical protein